MCILVPAGHLNAGTAADTSREAGSIEQEDPILIEVIRKLGDKRFRRAISKRDGWSSVGSLEPRGLYKQDFPAFWAAKKRVSTAVVAIDNSSLSDRSTKSEFCPYNIEPVVIEIYQLLWRIRWRSKPLSLF
jgi:hypothetical protein